MRHLNLQKRKFRQWRLTDILSTAVFGVVIVSFIIMFTGNPFAAPRNRQSPVRLTVDPEQHRRMVALVEKGEKSVDSCPGEDVDYMPCEDPKMNSQLSREMNFYRERHCPLPEETLLCLVPPPRGYRISVQWPESLHKIWHDNMPYNKIADRKGHQGWMKKQGPHFIFPGGGTMFPDGAEKYIEKLKKYIPIADGTLRTALDMGCGVASFGGYLLAEEILTLSFAPRDSHKSQIQFALERGLPTFVAMLGTRRLPFPAFSFDFVHCSRCLIPFTAYNATYFIEVDRLLRPGGYLVISGPPVKWPKREKEWADLQAVAQALCYEQITVDGNTAIWRKPSADSCRENQNELGFELCGESNHPNSAWYFNLKKCVTPISSIKGEYSVEAIPNWPERIEAVPSRETGLNSDAFKADTLMWHKRIEYYKKSLKIKLGTSSIRNVMDMNAHFGGFGVALVPDPVWVMNVVPQNLPLTLDVIYDRGLIGVYHDWCEPFSTYPRTYDLIHVDSIESLIQDSTTGTNRCSLVDLMVEMDRILRPEGTVVIRGSSEVINRVNNVVNAIRWTAQMHDDMKLDSEGSDLILVAKKSLWKLR